MKKAVLMVLALFMCVGVTGCSSDDDSSKKSEAKTEEKDTKKDSYAIGEAADINDINIKVNKKRIDKGLIAPKDGKEYLVLDITLTNNGKEKFNSSSLLLYKLRDGDGRELSVALGANLNGNLDSEVAAGKKLTGEIAFEVEKKGKLTLTFTPDPFSDESVEYVIR